MAKNLLQQIFIGWKGCTCLVALLFVSSCQSQDDAQSIGFSENFDATVNRAWLGPDLYANRLQDWRISDGRLEAVEGRAEKPMRTVQLLTYSLAAEPGTVSIEVSTGPVEGERVASENTWSGLLIGAGGDDVDYRISALVHHWPGEDGGLVVALDGTGTIIVRDNSQRGAYKGSEGEYSTDDWPLIEPDSSSSTGEISGEVRLTLHATPDADGYALDVTATNSQGELVSEARYLNIPADQLSGNVALVSHNSPDQGDKGYWFDDWQVSGSKLIEYPERSFGPIMGVQYTLSRGILKLTAQMGPLGEEDDQTARLQTKAENEWRTVAESRLITGSYTMPFRIDDWAASEDTEFRVVYADQFYGGTIRHPDLSADEFVLGVLNCNNISSGVDMQWNASTIWHPHTDLLASMKHHKPDMMFFAGDQLYEKGLAGIERTPLDTAYLDYLYHWNRFFLAFGDLTRDMPSVAIPDDHDVYHGNIWGEAGKAAIGPYELQHDNGGYIMDPAWVNAVHRTQTSHLPDPVDPEPIKQDISVFHTELNYAGLSFAIVADRMWKSAPRSLLPEAKIWNGWIENPDFNPHDSDVPEATLLGERQLEFLDGWTQDWSQDAWMKVVLSATPFTNVATLPDHATNDSVVPDLAYPEPGEYVDGDKSVADMDSNGWPQTGRNNALRTIRKGYAFHVAGDQHLSSFIQYGVDDWRDAGFAFVSPAIANYWPRRWFPPQPGLNREPGSPSYTGDHLDGFGNKLSVRAVANPVRSNREPAALYDRSPGYGIVRFRRSDRSITAESWPRWVDPSLPDAEQYPGWPVTVSQEQNYGRVAAGYLPTLRVSGLDDPVVQITDQTTDEVVYTIRAAGTTFKPKVFELDRLYRMTVSDPDSDQIQVFSDIKPAAATDEVFDVEF